MSGWRHTVIVEDPSVIPGTPALGRCRASAHHPRADMRTHTTKNSNVKKVDVFTILLVGEILPHTLTHLRPSRFPCWRCYLSCADSDISNPIYGIHMVLLTWPLTLCVSCKLAIKLNLDLSIWADFFARAHHYKVHTLPFVAHEPWPVSLLMSGTAA